MLRLRFITAAIGLPLIALALFLGPRAFAVFLGVVALVGTYELCALMPGMSRRDPFVVCAVALAVVLAVCRMLPFSGPQQALLATIPLVVSLVILLGYSHSGRTFAQWSWTVGGAVYVGWLLGHWGAVHVLSSGRELVIFGLCATFAYDTFAYFSGRAFGRHKLAPHLSSGKTWEGAVGGLVMAVAMGLLVRFVLLRTVGDFPFSTPATIAMSLVVAVAAQIGDLVESAVKRSTGVKDVGTILPGHGGMLDRFDSLLFVGPMLYYVTLWITA